MKDIVVFINKADVVDDEEMLELVRHVSVGVEL